MGRPKRHCEINDCEVEVVGRGMCKKHWQRWRKWGDALKRDSRWRLSPADRFWQYVEKTDGCWIWTAGRKNGYGNFSVTEGGVERMVQAHRFAYELEHGPIPDGMTLDHLCHTAEVATCTTSADCPHRACVRPDHLAPMSLRENIQRGGNGAKTHCKHGHEFTPDNIWWFTTQNGGQGRKCKTCGQAANRAKRKAA